MEKIAQQTRKPEGRQTRALMVPRVTVTSRPVVVNENDVDMETV